MLAARALSIPPPRSNDIDEVDCALTVAHARWRSGDFDDALKWVRKAARCAADTDQVERAVELSKSAAALEQVIRTTPPPQLQAAVKTDRPRWPASTALAKRRSARQPAARSGQHPLASRQPTGRSSRPAAKKSEERAIRQPLKTQPAAPGPLRSAPAPTSPATPKPLRNAPRRMFPPDEERTTPALSMAALQQAPSNETCPNLPTVGDADEPTLMMKRSDITPAPVPPARATQPSPHLAAMRVAVVHDGATGKPTLVQLRDNESAPEGAATAMLVAASEQDSGMLARLLGCDGG